MLRRSSIAECHMTKKIVFSLAAASLTLAPAPVLAKGCIRGAVAGGVAGHYAHHHAIMGAMAGCAAGHYYYKHKAKVAAAHARQPAVQTPGHH
jgi:uncharacterized membrane protein YedE/YeeE